MPELVLLAVVSLTAMGLLVFLFLKLNQDKTALIRLLTDSNQSLLNQARTTELSSLAGLNQMTTAAVLTEADNYISTEDREMAVWQQMLAAQQARGIGEEISYADDLAEMRGDL